MDCLNLMSSKSLVYWIFLKENTKMSLCCITEVQTETRREQALMLFVVSSCCNFLAIQSAYIFANLQNNLVLPNHNTYS